MKSRVIVRLKEGVLDPQGQTIRKSFQQLGYDQIVDVRQGKFFELTFDSDTPQTEVERISRELAGKVLSNPIIEKFEVEEPS